jgi:single-strand DNA-binding protein
MNKVMLAGYFTKEPEIEYHGQNNFASAKFTIACRRPFKNKETGKYDSDFIQCTATNKAAELIEKWFHKGSYIVVTDAWWRTGSYENKEGKKVFYNECVVNSIEFGNKTTSDGGNQTQIETSSIPEPQETTHNRPSANTSSDDDFINIDESATGDIPFFG